MFPHQVLHLFYQHSFLLLVLISRNDLEIWEAAHFSKSLNFFVKQSVLLGTKTEYQANQHCITSALSQGSYAIFNINFQTFKAFSRHFPDLTFLCGLPRLNIGSIIFNTI